MFEHTTGAAQVAGVAPERLVDLIEQGRSQEALLECLAFPVLPSLLRRLLGWRLSHTTLAVRSARQLGRTRVRANVIARRDALSAVDTIRFFYDEDSPLDHAIGDYFSFRFGQPRHLAALSLIQNVAADCRCVLDLGCGCGHLDHYLTSRRHPVQVVGMDLNFFHLWIARHWIAPGGAYVCAAADEGFPFADGSFSAFLCSDAYHFMANRAALRNEIERCAPGAFCVITRTGNLEAMPNEGLERTVTGYLEEISATDARIYSEEALVRLYLSRRNPLSAATEADMPAGSKWLSFAWNLPKQPGDVGAEDWPHAAGELGLNPLYRRRAHREGGVELVFEFPGIWYAYENAAMLAYHPRRVRLSWEQLEALIEKRPDPSFAELVAKFVLLGLPERFTPAWQMPRSALQ